MRPAPVLLGLLVSATLHAAVRITPELEIATPVPAPAQGLQRPDAVASDGTDFLIVWPDTGGVNTAVVAADGSIRVPAGLRIPRTDKVSEISVCWTGQVYVVTWQEGNGNPEINVAAAALSRDGALVAGPRIVAQQAITRTGSLGTNGRRALLVYTTITNDVSVPLEWLGVVFETDGSISASAVPLHISVGPAGRDALPRVASDGSEFALVWRTDNRTFHLARFAEDALPVGSAMTFSSTDDTTEFDVSHAGAVYAVAAMETHVFSPGNAQSRMGRYLVDANRGAVTDLGQVNANGGGTSVVWNGIGFVAYWMDSPLPGIGGRLMTLSFDSSRPVMVLERSRQAFQPRLAFNGRNILAAWSEAISTPEAGPSSAIYGVRLDAPATTLADAAPSLVSVGWSRQLCTAVATSGSDSLVIWIDEHGDFTRGRLLGMRFDANGAGIDKAPFEIAPSVALAAVPVVFTGTSYLVAWQEPDTDMTAARTVGRDGTLGARIALEEGYNVQAAASATTTLVVFDTRAGLIGYRFAPAGWLVENTPLVIDAGGGGYARVASNGTDFLVAWNVGSDYWQFPSPNRFDVVGKRVSASGAVDASPFPIAATASDEYLDAIASDGRDYLVVYGDPYATLEAKRVRREGVADAHVVLAAPARPYGVAATGDATGYSVVWYDQNGGALKFIRVDGSLAPGEPATLASLGWDSRPTALSLAQPPNAPLEIGYSRHIDQGPFPQTSLAFLRLLGGGVGRQRPARH